VEFASRVGLASQVNGRINWSRRQAELACWHTDEGDCGLVESHTHPHDPLHAGNGPARGKAYDGIILGLQSAQVGKQGVTETHANSRGTGWRLDWHAKQEQGLRNSSTANEAPPHQTAGGTYTDRRGRKGAWYRRRRVSRTQ